MTTVVYRDGFLAADSCFTEESAEGGSRQYRCQKLYTFSTPLEGYLVSYYVGFAGGSGWRMFMDWLRAGEDWSNVPEFTKEHDFTALVVRVHGNIRQVYAVDCNMEREPILEGFHAIGSGAKCAFGALDMGADADRAVEIAAGRDPYTRGPVVRLACA